MIRYVKGDLFTYPGLDAIGHGCNCRGVMGSGIAKQFADRYPDNESFYQEACAEQRFQPGNVLPYWADDGKLIMNLATQRNTGRDARGLWIAQALDKACHYLFTGTEDRRTFGICEIGSGIGGLSQDYCHYIFEETAERNPEVDLYVVQWEQNV